MTQRAKKRRAPYPDLGAVRTTIVGERGQVVIPLPIRQRVGLRPGDRMVVFVHPAGPLFMLPVKYLKGFMTGFAKHLSSIKI